MNGLLDLESEVWNIAIIERDVPCGFLAIEDLQELFTNLFLLESKLKGRKLPKINLSVFHTHEFQSCLLNIAQNVKSLDQFDPSQKYDAILDIAILQRSGFDFPAPLPVLHSNQYLKITSSHSIKSQRIINCAKPINYPIPEEEQPEALVYLFKQYFPQNQIPRRTG